MLKIDIVSVQPGMFGGFLGESMVARAVRKGACEINIVDLRSFAHDKRRTVDDRPYGGGPGMLMRCSFSWRRIPIIRPSQLYGCS